MLQCTCTYLNKELRGVQTLLSGCRCALCGDNCLYDLTNGSARALHRKAMQRRRPWTPLFLVLLHDPLVP